MKKIVVCILMIFGSSVVTQAADVVKALNSNALNLTNSWIGGVVPSAEDRAIFSGNNGSILTNQTGSTSPFWNGIVITNNIKTWVIGNADNKAISIGSQGIDLANSSTGGDFFISSAIRLITNQAWNVQAGARQLTVTGSVVDDSGSTSLTKTGAGTLALNSGNTFSGGLTINAGTVIAGHNSALGSGMVAINDSSILNAGGKTLANNITIGVGGGIFLNTTASTLTGEISGSGVLIKTGSGTLTLSGTNTHSSTVIMGGVLSIAKESSLPGWNLTGLYAVSNGAALAVGNAVTASNIGTILGTGNFAAGAGFGFDTTAGNRTYDNVISNAANGSLALVKVGANTLILSGNNTYSGATTISAGTLQVGDGGTTGTLGSDDITNNATLAINRSDIYTENKNISGSGSLIQSGTGTLILSGTNTYGATTISAGKLQVGDGGTTGTLGRGNVINNSVLAFNRSNTYTVSNDISGTGSLIKLGAGTLILASNNTFRGGVTINEGTLQIGDGSFGGKLGTGNVTNNAALVFNRSNAYTASNVISGAGSLTKLGAGALTLSGTNNTYSGLTTVAAGALIGTVDSAFGTSDITVATNATLVLQGGVLNNYIEDWASLRLATNATLTLNFTGVDTIGGISLDGGVTWLAPGVYNASAFSALGTGTYTGNGSFNAVPEPASALMIGFGGGLIALIRRFYGRT